MFMIFPSGVDRTDIKNFFLMRISESLVCKGQPAQNNQKNSGQNDWFHVDCPAAKPSASVLESC